MTLEEVLRQRAAQSPEEELSVIVTVAKATSRDALQEAGLTSMKELPIIQAVAGLIKGSDLSALEKVEGVERVEYDRQVSVL